MNNGVGGNQGNDPQAGGPQNNGAQNGAPQNGGFRNSGPQSNGPLNSGPQNFGPQGNSAPNNVPFGNGQQHRGPQHTQSFSQVPPFAAGMGQGQNQNLHGQSQPQPQNPGQQPLGQQPLGQPQAAGVPVAVQDKKRWSTPALAAMLLAGAVIASATTAVVVDQANSSHNVNSSFDTSSDSNDNNQNSSNPIDPGSTEDIAARVLPSVVSIQVMTSEGGGEGSGSIFTSDGMIVTNNHVVAGGDKGKITVRLNDGRTLPAKIVAADPQTDIAVIKAEGATDLQPIELGNSDALNVGESVIAIGSPLGLASTVTTGIVSAKNRPVQATGENGGEASLIDGIQTDAAINPGNSGGVLVNMEGKLVGIPSVIASLGSGQGQSGSIGLGFAIPVNQAQRIAQDLIEKGKTEHPMIGAKVNTQSDLFGAEIADVNEGSPAADAGLEKGDVVTKVDDRPVESGVGLIAAIRSHNVGDKVTLSVTNGDGKDEHTVEVTLGTE